MIYENRFVIIDFDSSNFLYQGNRYFFGTPGNLISWTHPNIPYTDLLKFALIVINIYSQEQKSHVLYSLQIFDTFYCELIEN
jgi:hypothetical protein